MKTYNLLNSKASDDLQQGINLYIEATMMVSAEFGSSLSHEEFMDKTDEYYCKLLEEDHGSIVIC